MNWVRFADLAAALAVSAGLNSLWLGLLLGGSGGGPAPDFAAIQCDDALRHLVCYSSVGCGYASHVADSSACTPYRISCRAASAVTDFPPGDGALAGVSGAGLAGRCGHYAGAGRLEL